MESPAAPHSAPLQVGPIRLPNRLAFAPLSGVSNLAARLVARAAGAGLVFSETVNAGALARGAEPALRKLETRPDEDPFVVQLFGADPAALGEAAARAIDHGVRWIDLNLGCPVRKFQRQGAGAAMLRDPHRVARAVAALHAAGPEVVSVKLRAGWDARSLNAPEVARVAVASGAMLVTIHGRTRAQQYRGSANPEWMRAVVEAVPQTPVFANGDVRHADDVPRLLQQTGAAGVMIGRGAIGNPWLFAEALGDRHGAPACRERLEVFERHLAWLERSVPEDGTRLLHLRRYAAAYTRGLPGSARHREAVMSAPHLDAVVARTRCFLADDATARDAA